MTIDLERYNELKDHAEQAQRDADKARGAAEQLTAQLITDFDCQTLRQARAKLKVILKEEADAEREYDKAYIEFVEKYPSLADQDE